MVARAIGSGTISFGMVAIPVKLYSAASPADEIHFNQLHAECGTRIKQRLYCPTHDRLIEREEIVKGYEFSKGKFVTFSDEELESLVTEASEEIDITEFVPLTGVDPVYFEKAYYLGPDKGGARPYHLLAEAMRRTGLSAVARYAARGREYLTLLRATDDGLIMQQLRHAREVRAFEEVPVPDADVKDAELDLAIRLIGQIASKKFEPQKYKDEKREKIEALIQKKVEGEEITAPATEAPKAQVIDLMEALKASLAAESAQPAPGVAAAPATEAATGAPERKAPKRAPAKRSKAEREAADG